MGTLICMNISITFAHFSICLAVLHKAPAEQVSRSPKWCISWGLVQSTGSQIYSKVPTHRNVQPCSWLQEQQSCPCAYGNTPSAFITGKIDLKYNFWVQRSQSHTRACPKVSRGVCKLRASLAAASLLSVFPYPFKGHSWDKAAESSPEGSWVKCLLKGAVTGGFQVFAQISFFFLSLAHSKHCSGDQSLQMGCFSPQSQPNRFGFPAKFISGKLKGIWKPWGENLSVFS